MINGKNCIILVERDFQDLEVFYPYYRLKEEGVVVKVVGGGETSYNGKFGIPITTDGNITDFNPRDFDIVIIPGGWAPDFMRRTRAMIEFVRKMNDMGKIIASICHGGWVLASADILTHQSFSEKNFGGFVYLQPPSIQDDLGGWRYYKG